MLIFDIKGKFAHFRKYDTNSSSLTYWMPPRTTLCGLIAAIEGMERDSYYDFFTPEKAQIALRVMSENRKIIQSLNYWKITEVKHFRNPKEPTQIPFEVLTNIRQIAYRVYFQHNDKAFMERIRQKIADSASYYAPYLGAAPFQCQIQLVEYLECKDVNSSERIPVSTVVKVDGIEDGTVEFDQPGIRLSRERMPRFFSDERYLKEAASYLVELGGNPLTMKYNGAVKEIVYNNYKEYITFM